MAAKSALISEKLAFATARALFRSNFPLPHRSFQGLTFVACARHYSTLSGQRERVALRPWPHTAAWRPPEAALGLRTYSSTRREEGGGGGTSKKGEKTRVSSSGTPEEQHGSVIMQFVERNGQPKELTTAKKGMYGAGCSFIARILQFWLYMCVLLEDEKEVANYEIY